MFSLPRIREKKVALKRLRIFASKEQRHKIHGDICREALLWQLLRHPRFVPFLGIDAETFPQYICMVSPWMTHGTVLRYMEGKNGRSKIDQHICDVAEGLEFLHSEIIVHGDVRGNNILIDDDERACLTDFGLTQFADPTYVPTADPQGSTRWMAPELFVEKFQLTSASDVWAFGCLCVELYTGKPPYPEIPHEAMVTRRVMDGDRPSRPFEMRESLWTIVNDCWGSKSQRITMSAVVERLKGFGFRDSSFNFTPILSVRV